MPSSSSPEAEESPPPEAPEAAEAAAELVVAEIESPATTTITGGQPLTDDWRSWLRLNLARGCERSVLYHECVQVHGFRTEDVEAALSDYEFALQLELLDDGVSCCANHNDTQNGVPTTATTTTTTTTPASSRRMEKPLGSSFPMTNIWKETIQVKLDQGVSREELFLYCLREGLNLDHVSQALGGYRARTVVVPDATTTTTHKKWPFQRRTFPRRAWRLDTALVELYEIPHFLSPDECQEIIEVIDNQREMLKQSTVAQGSANARTSRTCRLLRKDDEEVDSCTNHDNDNHIIITRLEQKFHAMMGVGWDPACAEPLQGQVYHVGEYYQPHCDWFAPDTEDYQKHCCSGGGDGAGGGQRTWTVMVYLNTVPQGGTTKFIHLEREYHPRQGLALAWNNLDADGKTPNPWTLHEAMPVLEGKKYILTKWFRERPMV